MKHGCYNLQNIVQLKIIHNFNILIVVRDLFRYSHNNHMSQGKPYEITF